MLTVEIGQYLASLMSDDPTPIPLIGTFSEAEGDIDIFIGHLPSEPDNCVSIISTGGYDSASRLTSDLVTIQILVRDLDCITVSDKAQAIYDNLHWFHGGRFTEDGQWIISCFGTPPAYIGKDDRDRFQYSINFTLEVTNSNRRFI